MRCIPNRYITAMICILFYENIQETLTLICEIHIWPKLKPFNIYSFISCELHEIGCYQQESLLAEDPNSFRQSTTSKIGPASKSQQILNDKIARLSRDTLLFVQERKGFWDTQAKQNLKGNWIIGKKIAKLMCLIKFKYWYKLFVSYNV